jgi:DNA topoisomerase IA
MDDYTILRSQVLLGFTYAKIQSSLDEIKTKHPTRTDLINSMEETLEHIQEVKLSWNQFEQEFRAMRQNGYRTELINLELKEENNRLKAELNAIRF